MSNLDLEIGARDRENPDWRDAGRMPQNMQSAIPNPEGGAANRADPVREVNKCQNVISAVVFVVMTILFFIAASYGAAKFEFPKQTLEDTTLVFSVSLKTILLMLAYVVAGTVVWIGFTLFAFRRFPYQSIWGTLACHVVLTALYVIYLFTRPRRNLGVILIILVINAMFLVLLIMKRRYFRINAFFIQTGTTIILKHFGLLFVALLFLLFNIGTLSLITAAIWFYYPLAKTNGVYVLIVLYIVFMFLWINVAGIFLLHTVTAGVASSWFMTPRNLERSRIGAALHRTLRYNLGTVALGALVNMAIKLLLSLVRSLFYELNSCLGAVCSVVIGFIDYLLDMFSDYLFVFVAIKGCAFSRATRKTFKFIRSGTPVFSYVLLDTLVAYNTLIGTLAVMACGWLIFRDYLVFVLGLIFSLSLYATLFLVNSSILTMVVCFEKYSYALNGERRELKKQHEDLVAALA